MWFEAFLYAGLISEWEEREREKRVTFLRRPEGLQINRVDSTECSICLSGRSVCVTEDRQSQEKPTAWFCPREHFCLSGFFVCLLFVFSPDMPVNGSSLRVRDKGLFEKSASPSFLTCPSLITLAFGMLAGGFSLRPTTLAFQNKF